jgi:hypothetical protein
MVSHLYFWGLLGLLVGGLATEECYAPYREMGEPCRAHTRLKGFKGAVVAYRIVTDSKRNWFFCEGLGFGRATAPLTCEWDFYQMPGTFPGEDGLIYWDEADDFPAVQCQAGMEATEYTLTFTVMEKSLSCAPRPVDF